MMFKFSGNRKAMGFNVKSDKIVYEINGNNIF